MTRFASALVDLCRQSSALPLALIGWAYLAYALALRIFAIETFPVCLFHLLTGIPCPLCGMTRAFGAIMTGHTEIALHFNTFAVPAFVTWIAFAVVQTIRCVDALRVESRCSVTDESKNRARKRARDVPHYHTAPVFPLTPRGA